MASAAAALSTGGLAPDIGLAAADASLTQPRPRVNLQAPSPALAPLIEARRAGREPFRVAPLGDVMFQGTQAFWGLEAIGGPDALRLPLADELSDVSGVERTSWVWRTMLGPGNLDASRGYLDMLNVRYLIAPRDYLPRGLRVLPLAGDDLVRVVERPTAWPRGFFVDGVERHDTVMAFAARLRQATSPFASVALHDRVAIDATSPLPPRATAAAAARNFRLTPNTTTMTIDAPGPGVAVLSEAFVAEDFQVTLNGEAAPYFRVNHTLKGVVIPGAGTWEIAFRYRPAGWTLSWALAAAGGVLAACMALYGRKAESGKMDSP
jgi:hypothetical protein